MTVAIVKYNAGNVQSVRFALDRLGISAIWTDDPHALMQADKVIFPGVGEASSAMRYLRERNLDTTIRQLQQPVLGICLGLQLFCRHSEENDTECLGIFDANVRLFEQQARLKVPQMGWNQLHNLQGPLFEGVAPDSYAYFVHSYYAERHPDCIAQCAYGEVFSAALWRNNFYAVQFHPEKSGAVGQQILRNFIENI
jgi:imidazole glycerol-phosphate synthase subunit HisH